MQLSWKLRVWAKTATFRFVYFLCCWQFFFLFFPITLEGYVLEGKIYALIKHKRLNLKRKKVNKGKGGVDFALIITFLFILRTAVTNQNIWRRNLRKFFFMLVNRFKCDCQSDICPKYFHPVACFIGFRPSKKKKTGIEKKGNEGSRVQTVVA